MAAVVVTALVVAVGVVVGTLGLSTDGLGPDRRGAGAHHPPVEVEQGLSPHRGVPVGQLDSSGRVATTITAGRLLFVGASYSVGWGATDPDDRYEDLVAHRLGRQFAINAVAGTGFTNPGARHEGTFAQRMLRIPTRLDPRIVVLQGGRDDQRRTPDEEYRAAVATIELARHRFVHAQVVVLGPVPATVPAPAAERGIDAALARACAHAGAGYVDAIHEHWITARDEHADLGSVPEHPDDRGYALIARRLVADLPGALRRAAPPLDPTDDPRSPQARAAASSAAPTPAG